ncbi:MAG: hypothetical protein LLF94_01085 [Chlamydiales bacterium]|nr:hypothetical protein [Chlamydiales bacterium]
MNQLCDRFKGLQIAQPQQETAWVKSLNLTYGTKNSFLNGHKVVTIEGDMIHYTLRCREVEERASRDYKDGVPNYVVASMSFVVSDRPRVKGGYHGRRVITVPVKFNEQTITHVTSVYPFNEKTAEPKKYSRSAEFLADLKEDSPATKQGRIEEYYKKGTNTFSDCYHHSERALWGALKKPTMIDALVEGIVSQMLLQARNTNPKADRIKVYAAVLDFHSTRYMCSECAPASFGFQKKQGTFIKRLEEALGKYFTLSPKNGLTLCTRVSADDEGKQSPVEAAEHRDYWRYTDIHEIRTTNKSLVLQRDDRRTQQDVKPHGVFVSSEEINPPLPVYLTPRKDNPLASIKLTEPNKQFNQHSLAIVKQVQEIINTIDKSQNFDDKLKLVQEAYRLQPGNINVIINYYNVLIRHNQQIASLEFLRKAQRHYVQHNGRESNNYKILRHALVSIFKSAFSCAFSNNSNEFTEQVDKLQWLNELTEDDFALFYFLRGLYARSNRREDDAKSDFEIAQKRLTQEDFATPQDFQEITGHLVRLLKEAGAFRLCDFIQ